MFQGITEHSFEWWRNQPTWTGAQPPSFVAQMLGSRTRSNRRTESRH